ncbi:MAG: hypothetical protein ABIJ09_09160 [Pseudomonadota bacterium]
MTRSAVLLTSLLLACASEQHLDPASTQSPAARRRAEVLDQLLTRTPGDVVALVERAELAAFFSDDDHARALLGKLPAPPATPPRGALLACELAAARRDYPAILTSCSQVLEWVPGSPLAELAASQLLLTLDQTRDTDATVAAALERARQRCAQQVENTASCLGLAIAATRAGLTVAAQRKDVAAYQKVLDRAGAIRTWRVCPEMAPDSVESFRRARQDLAQGPVDHPACRERRTGEASLMLATADPLGVQLVESWVHVPADSSAALLWQVPQTARILVDGLVVVDRDRWLRARPGSVLVGLQLAQGWHHLRALVLPAGSGDSLSLWALDRSGRSAVDRWQAHPPDDGPTTLSQLGPVPSTAATWLEAGLDVDRDPWRALRLVGAWTGDLLDDGERARVLARQLATRFPDSAAAWFALAEGTRSDPTLPETSRQLDMRSALAATLEHQPQHLIASYRLALLDQDERQDEALQRMQDLVAAHPDYPWGQRRVHDMLSRRGLPVPALAALDRSLALAPGETSLGYAVGFFERRGMVQRAVEARQAQLDSSTTLFSARRGQRLREQGDLAGALKAYEQAFELAPDRPGFEQLLEVALAVEGWDGVQRRVDDRLQMFPRDLLAARWLVRAGRARGDLEAALRRAEAIRLGLPTWQHLRERASGLDPDRHLRVDTAALVADFGAHSSAHPELYAGFPFVFVLDAAAQIFTGGGGGLRITHQILRVQSKEAASQLGEVRPPAGAELRALRVIKADGRVIEPEAAHSSGDVSLSGIDVGDFIELHWIQEQWPDAVDHDQLVRFFFATQVPIFCSQLVLVGPSSEMSRLQIHSLGLPPPQRQVDDDQVRLQFEARDVPAHRTQPFAPSPVEVLPHVTASHGVDIGLYARRALRSLAEAERTNADLDRFARDAVAGKRGDDSRLRALVEAVVRRVRDPGPERDPVTILAAGRGDRQALLRAAGRQVGLDLRWVALHRASPAPVVDWPDSELPERVLLHHTARGDRPLVLAGRNVALDGWFAQARGGHWVEVDPVLATAPQLGRAQPVPDTWVCRAPSRMNVEATLDGSGRLDGSLHMVVQSPLAGYLRQRLRAVPLDDTARAIEGWFGSIFPGAALHDFAIDALDDDLQPLALRARFDVASYALANNGDLVIARFLPSLSLVLGGERAAPASYLRVGQRSVAVLMDPHHETAQVILHLPAGLRPRSMPAELAEEGPFGRYHQHAHLRGDALEVKREIDVPYGRVEVEQEPALRALGERVEARTSTQLVLSAAP